MDAPARPVAARLRRPGWRDPRLVVGVLLIAVAVAAVATVLRQADRTWPVYAAHGTLVPGTVLEPSDLAVVHVRVGDGYLAAPADAPWGGVLTRTVGDGELLPAGAVAARDAYDGRPVAVTAGSPVSEAVEPGALVDVWVTRDGDPPSSARVAESVAVSAVERDDGAFGTGGDTVYVMIAADDVGRLLDALAADGEVTVVGIG